MTGIFKAQMGTQLAIILSRLFLLAPLLGLAGAEDGLAAWLRYAPVSNAASYAGGIPSTVVALNTTRSSPVCTAGVELQLGISSIFSKDVQVTDQLVHNGSSITVGTLGGYQASGGSLAAIPELTADGFWLDTTEASNVLILGQNERGALYGAFHYLSLLAQGNFTKTAYASNPSLPIRWINSWDNLSGSIERGYGGASIFFANGTIKPDLTRAAQYARLMASLGLNGIIINNVNADATLLTTTTNVAGLARIAAALRPYGVAAGIALNFAAPNATLGTFDPLDARVIAWWARAAAALYAAVPDLAGFLVKGDAEGQPGPATYHRTAADGANLLARAAAPHGGTVVYRAFVYDRALAEAEWTADRARAAVDRFAPLDGRFDANVVVQIKYGPIDFQVREPASPLFAALAETNVAIELQVAQEYLGQQCHLVYLAPLWKTILDFDLRVGDAPSLVRDIVSGQRFGRKLGGAAAVVNAGTNTTWLGSHMAMSNLYAYGRLAWDPTQAAEPILRDWTRLTFSADRAVVDTVAEMAMLSWPAYENYTGNLGVQTLTNILGNHYGPKPQAQERNGYGQWLRPDAVSVGMDRTVANGTGFAGQYPAAVAAAWEDVARTPDDLLLWFHHVPWTHVLRGGQTVIQHFYDAHQAGAATAHRLVAMWQSLQGRPGIDEQRYRDVLFRQEYQAGHALVWRDAITDYFHNMTRIADANGRVGVHPHRIEAEGMVLEGYETFVASPAQAASGYSGVKTAANDTVGRARAVLDGFESGTYDVAVNYFDIYGGRSHWEIFIGKRSVGSWEGNMEDTLGHAMSWFPDESAAARVTFRGVSVTEGEELVVVGRPDGTEGAFLDYVSLLPEGTWD